MTRNEANPGVSQAEPDRLLESMWAFQQGEVAAFDVLYAALWPSVYGRARRMALPPEEAEDITQKVLVRVYEKAADARFDSEKGLWGWVYTIARREVYKQWKRRRPELISDEGLEGLLRLPGAAEDDPADAAVDAETLQDLGECVQRLGEKDRLYLAGPLVQGLPFRHVAALHRLTLGQFKHRYEKALAAVRDCMCRKGHDFPVDSAHGRP